MLQLLLFCQRRCLFSFYPVSFYFLVHCLGLTYLFIIVLLLTGLPGPTAGCLHTAMQRIGGNDESPQPAFSLLGWISLSLLAKSLDFLPGNSVLCFRSTPIFLSLSRGVAFSELMCSDGKDSILIMLPVSKQKMRYVQKCTRTLWVA